jgi:hypothetical protein
MIVAWIVAFFCGAIVGAKLANRGVSADRRFDANHHQGWFLGGITAIAVIVLLLLLLYKFNQVKLIYLVIPSIVLLYIGEYLYDAVICSGFFVLGLLILLELEGRNSVERMRQLFIAIVAICVPISVLIHYSLPIIDLVGEPKIVDGVVLQTTSFTCAPSSIATLARFVGKYPNILEKDVVKLTKTDRNGTSTLAEMRAMGELGLGADFRHNLTVDDLVKINKPGLLHVKVKYNNKEIAHTVALLSVNPKTQTLTIANPLSGIEVKRFDELKGYWMNEAVFVSR